MMISGRRHPLLEHVNRMAGIRLHRSLTDRQLLERFALHHDETAFAELVQRHGALVWGVCRRILRHDQDAEDIFQAVFLVLARKAGTIRWWDTVANWLYEVAYRLAAEARARIAQQHERERPTAALPQAEGKPPSGNEVSAILDEELQRLPEKYRVPLLLCYLEGKTRDQAAGQLGWALRTLERRLAQGREHLRLRLARRGVTLSAALLVTELAPGPATAGVPPLLAAATIKGALSFTSPTALTGRGAALAEAALAGTTVTKGKTFFALLVLIGVLSVGAGVLARPAPITEHRQSASPEPSSFAASENRTAHGDAGSVRADFFGDPLPPHARARLGTIRLRHGSTINAVTFSPDGKTLAAAAQDQSLRLWDAATGKELKRFVGSGGSAVSVAFSPDGTLLASSRHARGNTVCLWDVLTREARASLERLGRQSSISR